MNNENDAKTSEEKYLEKKANFAHRIGEIKPMDCESVHIATHNNIHQPELIPEPDQGPDVPPEVKQFEHRGPVVHGDCEPSQLKRHDDIKPPVIDETEPPQPTAPDKQPTEKETTLFNPRNNPFYKGR